MEERLPHMSVDYIHVQNSFLVVPTCTPEVIPPYIPTVICGSSFHLTYL